MLALEELESLFDHLQTPEAGRKFVRKVRREAPVRQVQCRRGGNVITRFCSQKMARIVETESRTVEYPAVICYERDQQVLEYFAQPAELDIVCIGLGGKPDRNQHTPDFLVIRKDGIAIEEWREEARLVKLAAKYPGRYQREESGWRYPAAEHNLADKGIDYRLRSADEHPRRYIQNLIFLGDYLRTDALPLEITVCDSMQKKFRDRAAIPLRELLGPDGYCADEIYKAIADEVISFDLFNENLADTDRVLVFRDATSMAFHLKVAQVQTEPVERLDVSIVIGGKIRFDNKDYEIALVGLEKILIKSGEESAEIPLDLLERLHQEGRLSVISQGNKPCSMPNDQAAMNHYAPAMLDAALERAGWIERATISPELIPRSERSLQRYRRDMRQAGDSIYAKHVALIPRYAACGNRKRKIPAETIELAEKSVRKYYNTPTNMSKRSAYIHFLVECQSKGIAICSERSFVKEVERFSSVGLRGGKREAYQLDKMHWNLDHKEAIHGVRPFQFVHIDHTEVQLQVYVPGSEDSCKRAWLTLAMDAESRAVVGYYVAYDAPSYRSTMMAMRDTVRRHGRMPEMFVLDNGKDFHSRAMHRFCKLYGSDIRYRPAGQPRVGSVMERLFLTTQTEFFNRLAGNTQVLLHPRMATKSVMPENFKEFTLPALHGALDHYFAHWYGERPHQAHGGESPVAHMRSRMSDTGERRNRMVRYDHRFLIESCPSPLDGETRVVDGQRGVKIFHIWYWHDALRNPRLKGKHVDIRIDPWDVRYVYALVGNEWCQCASKLVGRLDNLTEVELRSAYSVLREKFKTKPMDTSPERLAEWINLGKAENFDNRLIERQAESRLIYDALGMGSISSAMNLLEGKVAEEHKADFIAIPLPKKWSHLEDPEDSPPETTCPISGPVEQPEDQQTIENYELF
jgi:putative transposase